MRIVLADLPSIAIGLAQRQPVPAANFDPKKVGEKRRNQFERYLPPKQAADRVMKSRNQVLLLDARTRAEPAFAGMATRGDALVPCAGFPAMHAGWHWDDTGDADWYEPFIDFAPELAQRLTAKGPSEDDPIVPMGRCGDRSPPAASLLADLGYERVDCVAGGIGAPIDGKSGRRDIGGCKNAGLPWSDELHGKTMYVAR